MNTKQKAVLAVAKRMGWMKARFIEAGGCCPFDATHPAVNDKGLIPYDKQWGDSIKGGTYPFFIDPEPDGSMTVFGDPHTRRKVIGGLGWTFAPFKTWDSAGLVLKMTGDRQFVDLLIKRDSRKRRKQVS
jgi:hypothetical protein